MQIPVTALGNYLGWTTENYAVMVGGDQTLFRRFLSQGSYPPDAVAQDSIAQEAAPIQGRADYDIDGVFRH